MGFSIFQKHQDIMSTLFPKMRKCTVVMEQLSAADIVKYCSPLIDIKVEEEDMQTHGQQYGGAYLSEKLVSLSNAYIRRLPDIAVSVRSLCHNHESIRKNVQLSLFQRSLTLFRVSFSLIEL